MNMPVDLISLRCPKRKFIAEPLTSKLSVRTRQKRTKKLTLENRVSFKI
jgi:hypothetical protein